MSGTGRASSGSGIRAARVLLAVAAVGLGSAAPAASATHTTHSPPHLSRELASRGARSAPVHLGPGRIPGPSSISLGLVDQDLFLFSSGPLRSQWLARGRALGSSVVRLTAYWGDIAPATLLPGFNPSNPADPNYNFSQLDSAVQAASAAGEQVVVVVGWAPIWAEGSPFPPGVMGGAWEPNVADYRAFATAIARRYSGHFFSAQAGVVLPHVAYFQAWNEPNLPRYLMPQWEGSGNGQWIATSPTLYRSLLNAFYSSVKAVDRTDTVIAAGLAPYGDPPATGQGRMYPVTFLEQMLCLDPNLKPFGPCPNPAHFDALDMHPYAISPTVKSRVPGDVSVPDLGKISRIVRAAQRFRRALPAGPKPLWVTELDWSTVPARSPSPISLLRQTRFLPLGFYELWRQGVSTMFWFQLRDPPNQGNVFAGGGLYFGTGVAKPSAAAYRFPFIAIPAHHHKLTIWGRAPAPGSVVVQKLTKRGWRSVLVLTTTAGGVFYANFRLGSHLQLRAKAGSAISPVWATSGPM